MRRVRDPRWTSAYRLGADRRGMKLPGRRGPPLVVLSVLAGHGGQCVLADDVSGVERSAPRLPLVEGTWHASSSGPDL
jgi:hypothetical protein